MRSMLRFVAAPALLLAAFIVPATAQDFQKTYRLGAGASISIRNVSGNVIVRGADTDAITVNGFKEGRDRDKVEIEDMSGPGNISVGVQYQRPCNCDASVRFEVLVPRSISYQFDKISTASGDINMTNLSGDLRVHTASGNVSISDISGKIDASTASGEMRVKNVTGTVSAKSASGNVEVEITRLDGTGNMEFASASGDVSVRMPSDLDGEVYLSSATGSLKTDFPLQIETKQYGPGERARGRLGNGSRSLRITSATGDVSLLRFGGSAL